MNFGYIGPTPITEYGCCACQKYHRRGMDPEYEAHLYRQDKHGVRTRAPIGPAETFVAEMQAMEARGTPGTVNPGVPF